MKSIITFISVLLCSCTVHPFSNGKVTSLGGSVFTKADAEYARATTPDGTTLEYGMTRKDETVVPAAYLRGVVLIKGINSLTSIAKSRDATTVALDKGVTSRAATVEATKQAKIAADAAVETTAITTPGP